MGGSRTINFPEIKTGSLYIDNKLNKNLRQDILFDSSNGSIDSILKEFCFGASYLSLNTNITYNRNSLISIAVSSEFCSANCSSYEGAFVYSLASGERITMAAVVAALESVRS